MSIVLASNSGMPIITSQNTWSAPRTSSSSLATTTRCAAPSHTGSRTVTGLLTSTIASQRLRIASQRLRVFSFYYLLRLEPPVGKSSLAPPSASALSRLNTLLYEGTKEALNLRRGLLLRDLGFGQSLPTMLFCDNNGAITCTKKTASRHIDMRIHFCRQNV